MYNARKGEGVTFTPLCMNRVLNKELLQNVLTSLEGEGRSRNVGEALGYIIKKNPIDPDQGLLFQHPDLHTPKQAVMAAIEVDELDASTPVRSVRRLYEKVEELKSVFSGRYDVPLLVLVGKHRFIIYRTSSTNRDERIDVSWDALRRSKLVLDQLNALLKDNITIEEDLFGSGFTVNIPDGLFKNDLGTYFSYTVQFYQKIIAQNMFNDGDIKQDVIRLLSFQDRQEVENQSTSRQLMNANFKIAIGNVVNTIVLRVVLRKFLEAYHGEDIFNQKEYSYEALGLGERKGKMREVIEELVHIRRPQQEEEKKLKEGVDSEYSVDLIEFLTSSVEKKDENNLSPGELYEAIRKQFEMAYGGDLFSGDIAEVTNRVERKLNERHDNLVFKLLVDLDENRFNFRYEDIPPELIQDFYETSMGKTIGYKIDDNGNSRVQYGEDAAEKKTKGAYYTKDELVTYAVRSAVGEAFGERIEVLKEAIESKQQNNVEQALEDILDFKVIDITSGGGSFLRGAFRYLSSLREQIRKVLRRASSLPFYEELSANYPQFSPGVDGEQAWEKHLLLWSIYGIDIDYKALVISSQTLTLSALGKWQPGENFPELVGHTLAQQNSLIFPVSDNERKEAFAPYADDIKELIAKRQQAVESNDDALRAEIIRNQQRLTSELNKRISTYISHEYMDALMPGVIEVAFPEVFFHDNGDLKNNAGFDVSLGNPPWEIWKPNADEFFEPYDPNFRRLTPATKKKQRQEELMQTFGGLREKWKWFDHYYKEGSQYVTQSGKYRFQKTKVNGKLTGSDINLYKTALERNYQLLKPHGISSYLVPSGTYTDLGAAGLRKMLFEEANVKEILGFENTKGIFKDIDSRMKFAVITFKKEDPSETFDAFFYRKDLKDLEDETTKFRYPLEIIERLSPDSKSVVEARNEKEFRVILKMSEKCLLKDWFHSFLLCNDLHATGDSTLFLPYEESEIPLFEGKNIGSGKEKRSYYELVSNPVYGTTHELLAKKLGSKTKKRIESERLGFRSIARSTDKRTMIATMIPANSSALNSLILKNPERSTTTIDDDKYLLGFFSSFVFDFLLRRRISANLNMFYIYQSPVPQPGEATYSEEIRKRVNLLLNADVILSEYRDEEPLQISSEEKQEVQNQIDAYVAKEYGLTREELNEVLATFQSPKHKDEMIAIGQGVIESFDTLEREGELTCPSTQN